MAAEEAFREIMSSPAAVSFPLSTGSRRSVRLAPCPFAPAVVAVFERVFRGEHICAISSSLLGGCFLVSRFFPTVPAGHCSLSEGRHPRYPVYVDERMFRKERLSDRLGIARTCAALLEECSQSSWLSRPRADVFELIAK